MYKSNYEHVNIHSEELYKRISENFDIRDLIYDSEKIKNNTKFKTLISSLFDVYDINNLYIIKRLDDGRIVYLCYIEKNNDMILNYSVSRDIEENLIESADEVLTGKIDRFSDYPEIFSNVEIIKYMYPLYSPDNSIVGIIGFDINVDIIKAFADSAFTKGISNFVICMILFSFLVIFVFYKFFNRMLISLVYTDNLTKLKNRVAYEEEIERLNSKVKNNFNPNKEKIYALAFDLNDLKFVNDNLGHLAGDEYIHSAGNMIRDVFGEIGVTYRVGGDEFTTIVTKASSDGVIEEKIKELEKFEKEYNDKGSSFLMSISVGYSSFKTGYDMNMISVIKRADEKMYKDKKIKKIKMRYEVNDLK